MPAVGEEAAAVPRIFAMDLHHEQIALPGVFHRAQTAHAEQTNTEIVQDGRKIPKRFKKVIFVQNLLNAAAYGDIIAKIN